MGINSQNGAPTLNYQISSGSYHTSNGVIGSSISSNFNPNSLQLVCCLIENGTKCTLASGNASYSKRIEKQVAQRKLRLVVDPHASHTYICEHHKQIIQSIRTSGKRKRKDDDGVIDDDLSTNDGFNGINDSSNDLISYHTIPLNSNSSMKQYNPSNDIDLHSLQLNTLRRYKRHFRIPIKLQNKTQLADELLKHFRTIIVDEKDVINTFMYTVKNNRNKLDSNSNKLSGNAD